MSKRWGPTLRDVAMALQDTYGCDCTDADGNAKNPSRCECGGDGMEDGQSSENGGCWVCMATRALINARAQRPSKGGRR